MTRKWRTIFAKNGARIGQDIRRNMARKWKIILGALFLLAAAGFAISQGTQKSGVEVIKVAPTDIKRSFTEEGLVVPLQERTVYLPYAARVVEVLVKEGDRIEAGELMVILDDTELQYTLRELGARLGSIEAEKLLLEEAPPPAELESCRLRIEEAAADLERALQNYKRMKQLYEQGALSKVELEEAEDLVSKAEYNLVQQEKALQVLQEAYSPSQGSREVIEAQKRAILAQMDLIKYQIDKYRLLAPISGVIAEVNVEEGGVAGPQAPLLRLFQEGDYRVEARVLTGDIYALSIGKPVNLLLKLRDQEIIFPGEIAGISPYAKRSFSALGLEEERVKVTIRPESPAALKIAPGYKLEVEFTTEELFDVLVVPKSALFTYQGEDALLVVEEGRARVRPVTTGLETRQKVVITGGLNEGDLVILNPQDSAVNEGARVAYRILEQ